MRASRPSMGSTTSPRGCLRACRSFHTRKRPKASRIRRRQREFHSGSWVDPFLRGLVSSANRPERRWTLAPDRTYVPVMHRFRANFVDPHPGREHAKLDGTMKPLVTVETFSRLIDARLAQARLESSGLRTYLADESVASIDPFLIGAIGGVKLQVELDQETEAREILSGPPVDESAETI